jgi:hypothetical protein
MNEIPHITKSAYLATAYAGPTIGAAIPNQVPKQNIDPFDFDELQRRIQGHPSPMTKAYTAIVKADAQLQKEKGMAIRIVKVYIADPSEDLPLNKRVLHTGEEKLTDLTDQELFFELNIGEILKTHNEVRATTLDKKASTRTGKDVYLEPIRIRDLKMVVVDVATF